MKMIQKNRFMDIVNNKPVNLYIDKFDRCWLAHTSWSWFRVKWPVE